MRVGDSSCQLVFSGLLGRIYWRIFPVRVLFALFLDTAEPMLVIRGNKKIPQGMVPRGSRGARLGCRPCRGQGERLQETADPTTLAKHFKNRPKRAACLGFALIF